MNDDYINSIPDDIIDGVLFIIDDYFAYRDHAANNNGRIKELDYFKDVVEYYHLLSYFLSKHNYEFEKPEIKAERGNSVLSDINNLFENLREEFIRKYKERSIVQSNEKYSNIFENTFAYEFSEDDLKRVQELINKLREDISNSDLFESDHQRRLLKRLEKLQSELHKKVSDLDRFWGLIGDAGVVIGKFGKDVKPMVDRIREIAGIVWRTQSKSEGLPSGTKIPFLDNDEDKDNI